jgi:hypothetical protein
MSDYKATPKQWQEVGAFVSSTRDCILELRVRVEALEAQADHIPDATKMVPPPVATNDELIGVYNDCPEDSQKAALRDVYNLGVTHGRASSREVAEPAPVAGELVERVSWLIAGFASRSKPGDDCKPTAVKIVVEVTRWLRERHWNDVPIRSLEQEAGR